MSARAAVASPHHLASAIGADVLADGGNAVDAAVATNLALGAVTPYLCGYGGDLFALVWDGRRLHAYNGSGRAPAAARPSTLRTIIGSARMPDAGPHTVTVPGAVAGWHDLLERFGSRSFAELAAPAIRLAADGFVLGPGGARAIAATAARIDEQQPWHAIYGGARAGEIFRQPGLARTIERIAAGGPAAYYRGPIADAIAAHLRARGGVMAPEDLASHRGDWVQPISAVFRDLEVVELPPNTQGVTALQALRIAERIVDPGARGPARDHLLIEAAGRALADRDAYVSDPASMTVTPGWLLDDARIAAHADAIDPEHASAPASQTPEGGTAYLCAADDRGTLVSLIQSNFAGFGSGETVEPWGINLHNRGASFSLDPGHVNAIAPGKRPMHTLIPAMGMREGRPVLVFGTMGGHGQAQIHLQLLVRMLDEGLGAQAAIDAPRWIRAPGDGSVLAERAQGEAWLSELRARGHRVQLVQDGSSVSGHAHAIEVAAGGVRAAADPRSEGAALEL